MPPDDPNRKRKPRKPAKRKNTKVTGERSEAAFLYRASHPSFNFGIAKPWETPAATTSSSTNGRRLFRIQIKCTESIRADAYETSVRFRRHLCSQFTEIFRQCGQYSTKGIFCRGKCALQPRKREARPPRRPVALLSTL
jgi:hypothetical protein